MYRRKEEWKSHRTEMRRKSLQEEIQQLIMLDVYMYENILTNISRS